MSLPQTQHSQLQGLAYNALNTYFTSHSHETLEIEVLPPALSPPDSLILEDGSNLGVPKKTLALAFVHARHLFFAHQKSAVQKEQIKAQEATRIILLFDPEHLTAVNHRKRHLLSLVARNDASFVDAVWAELRFMNTILTSPLHRQSKSPTLWAHRTWWLDYTLPMLLDSEYDAGAFFAAELEAVMKAGERHPKNYYAWLYARRVVGKREGSLWGAAWQSFLKEVAEQVLRWCQAHPSDISGFSFLGWVLELLDSDEEIARVVKAVMEYAMDVRLGNESLWTFVRVVMANQTLGDEGRATVWQLILDRSKDLASIEETLPFKRRIMETLKWSAKNGTVEDTPRIQEIVSNLQKRT